MTKNWDILIEKVLSIYFIPNFNEFLWPNSRCLRLLKLSKVSKNR